MKIISISFLLAFAIACAPISAVQADTPAATTPAKPPSAWAEGGLEIIVVEGLDVVYFRPGANLAEYSKIMLGPVSVSFRKNWEKSVTDGSRTRIRAEDTQRIKERLATLVREEFGKQLSEGGYELSDKPGGDVLEVNMAIVDLYVVAPDLATAGRSASFAVSAGEMSLVAELRDSSSGDIIARAFDRTKARESIRPRRITNIDNANEARLAASGWAKALREQLDLARKIVN